MLNYKSTGLTALSYQYATIVVFREHNEDGFNIRSGRVSRKPDGFDVLVERIETENDLLNGFETDGLKLLADRRVNARRSREGSRKGNRHGREERATTKRVRIFRACVDAVV